LETERATSPPRHRNRLLLIGLFLVLAVVLVAGRWVVPAVAQTPPPPVPSRPAAYTRCPDLVLTFRPPGFVMTERRLQALSDNHMGKVETYLNGQARISTYSGVDAIDALEDMELVGRPVRAGGRDFVLHHTAALRGLLLAQLQQQDQDPEDPCGSFEVLTYNVPTDVMMALLEGLDIRARSDKMGVATE
jgi:hypothetical protein